MKNDSKVTMLKRIDRLNARIERGKTHLRDTLSAHADLRAHYGSVVAKHLATTRNLEQQVRNLEQQVSDLTTAAIQDRFKLQEYENQVAVQWKDNAGLGQDVLKLEDSNKKYREMTIRQGNMIEDLKDQVYSLRLRVESAEARFSYRLWMAITTQIRLTRMAIATQFTTIGDWFVNRTQRIVNRWKIRRLNARRVDALREGGYIPEKLVKMALKYYDHDKNRLDMDDEIREIHGGRDQSEIIYRRRPSLLRRIKILLGVV